MFTTTARIKINCSVYGLSIPFLKAGDEVGLELHSYDLYSRDQFWKITSGPFKGWIVTAELLDFSL